VCRCAFVESRRPEEFGTTALYELAHRTGHPSRLNRDLQHRFGSNAYAMEKLRAQLASVFVATELDIPTAIPHHASYIASWIKPLKNDKREILRAAADAQTIADMELRFHPKHASWPSDHSIGPFACKHNRNPQDAVP
jgi:antirestriction protein ArdC